MSCIIRSSRDFIIPHDDIAYFSELSERLSLKSGVQLGDYIFISRLSRTQKSSYRALLNEQQLIHRLVGLGFLIVDPDSLPFEAQISVFRHAKVVVGLGGAGLFNAVFCMPGTIIVTIESSNIFVDSHTNLFSSMGLRYGVIFGSEDLSDERTVHRRWTIDVDRAIDSIKKAIF
jgi:capsular polysaccharide biosynthesis protein